MEKKIYLAKLVSLNGKTLSGSEKEKVVLEILDNNKVRLRTPISSDNLVSISDLRINFSVVDGAYEFQTDYALIDRVMF